MVYYQIELHLKPSQAEKLASGKKISISQKAQSGQGMFHPEGKASIFLTKGQILRIQKQISAGKSSNLTMSKKQLNHHAQKGQGFFSNLVRKIYNTVKEHAPAVIKEVYKIAKPVIEPLFHQAISSGKDVGNLAIQRGIEYGERGINDLTRLAKAELNKKQKGNALFLQSGRGFPLQGKGNKVKTQSGESFFSDIFDGVKSIAKPIADIALPIVVPAIQKGISDRISGKGIYQHRQKDSRGRFVSRKTQNGSSLYL